MMSKFKLWDSNDVQYGEFDTMEDAYKEIQNYTTKNKISVYYYRQNLLEDNVIYVDYGSHIHFFYIGEVETNV